MLCLPAYAETLVLIQAFSYLKPSMDGGYLYEGTY